jgi:hypothetical protein
VNAYVADRFTVHDLLRLYAAEMLRTLDGPADVRAAGLRMLDHYLHTAWTAAKAISPARELPSLSPVTAGVQPEELPSEAPANGWLNAERQVLMRAIRYAYAAGFDTHAWQLPWAMTDFLDRSEHWHEWKDSLHIALAAAQRLGDTAAEARASRYLGRASFQLQQFDEALEHLSRARTLRQ